MSKRFGRNQRRRAREELAATVADSAWHQSRASHYQTALWEKGKEATRLRSHAEDLQRQLDEARACLGENHPAFDPAVRAIDYKPQPEDPYYLRGPNGEKLPATVMRFGRAKRHEYRKEVHFRLYAGQEVVGYVISLDALQKTPRDVLARAITEGMVEHLMAQLAKGVTL